MAWTTETRSYQAHKSAYEVFLSFRGEDTRFGFTDHLYEALTYKGIHTFRDNEELKMGEIINLGLLKAIEESRFAVVVLSSNYASSRWCLEELVHIMKCSYDFGLQVFPVFYHVDPHDVRNQKGAFKEGIDKHDYTLKVKSRLDLMNIADAAGWDVPDRCTEDELPSINHFKEAFDMLEKDFKDQELKVKKWMEVFSEIANLLGWKLKNSAGRKQLEIFSESIAKLETDFKNHTLREKKWREALKEIGNLKGIHLEQRHETEVVKEITGKISDLLSYAFLSMNKKLVGIESRMRNLGSFLDKMSDEICIMGIWGMGGIGKTTIAQEIFKTYRHQFESHCFIENVRKKARETDGLVSLQKYLCKALLNCNVNINNVVEGKITLQQRLRHKNVLIILDDVDGLDQLEALGGMDDKSNNIWLGAGSRVIVTTRDERQLEAYGVPKNMIYKVNELKNDEAFELFCQKAFKQDHAPDEYRIELSQKVVQYCSGVPLAIEVLGSSLYKRNDQEWSATLNRLEEYPDEDIMGPLQISFDGLNEPEKDMFLDIACFFNGSLLSNLVDIFEACGFYPGISIKVLEQKSLITIEKFQTVRTHDLLQKMARHIICQQYPKDVGKRSRLWRYDDVLQVLQQNKETNVEVLQLSPPNKEEIQLKHDPFSKMPRLRMLRICSVTFHGLFEPCLPNKLRILEWYGCPLKFMPSTFQPKQLVVLAMRGSCTERLWNEKLRLEVLIHIDLSNCESLTVSPDFSKLEVPRLKELILKDCKNLQEVHPSTGDLQQLLVLDLKNCENLGKLPHNIILPSLEYLNLGGCAKLTQLPETLGKMKQLVQLDVSGTAISEFPTSIEQLTCLTDLYTSRCNKLLKLPSAIHRMPSLTRMRFVTMVDNKAIIENETRQTLWLFPCTRIPEWISHSSHGPLIKVELPPEAKNGVWVAFVVFVVFEKYKHDHIDPESGNYGEICCEIYTDEGKLDSFQVDPAFNTMVGTVGFCYLCRLQLLSNDLSKANSIAAIVCSQSRYLEVKYCGFHGVSEHETADLIEIFDKGILDDNGKLDFIASDNCKQLDQLQGPGYRKLSTATNKFVRSYSELEELFLILFQGANARKYGYSFVFPGSEVATFFLQCVGDIAICYLPRNLFDDERWIGVELYAMFSRTSSGMSRKDNRRFLQVELYIHGINAAFRMATFSIKIGKPPSLQGQTVLFHIPRAFFSKDLNQCIGISAFFTSPFLHIIACGVNLVYEQDLDPLLNNIINWTARDEADFYPLICRAKEYVKRCSQCLFEADTLDCNAETDIPSGCDFHRELMQSLQKLLTSIEPEVVGITTSFLKKNNSSDRYWNLFDLFGPIKVHSPHYIFDSMPLILQLMSGKPFKLSFGHLHIMAENALRERKLENWKMKVGSLLPRFLSATVTLSFNGHIISVLQPFDPLLTHNFCFPRVQALQSPSAEFLPQKITLLPDNLYKDNNWTGLVIFTKFSFDGNSSGFLDILRTGMSFKVFCLLQSEGTYLNPIPMISITRDKFKMLYSHGLMWITYVPRVLLTELSQQSYIVATVEGDCPHLKVENCSLHLLYKSEMEEFREGFVTYYRLFLEDIDIISEFEQAMEIVEALETSEQQKMGFRRDQLYNSWFSAIDILEWFKSCRSNGPSTTIYLPLTLSSDSNWIGLAYFAYFSDVKDPYKSHHLSVNLTTEDGSSEYLSYHTPSYGIKWDHDQKGFIWLSYIPRSLFLEYFNFSQVLEASFPNEGSLDVESCGIRVIYQHEEKEFKHLCIRLTSLETTMRKRASRVLRSYNDGESGPGTCSCME